MLSLNKPWIKSKLEPREFEISDAANYWREKIFLHILLFLSVTGLIALIIGGYYAIKIDFVVIAIVDLLAYLALLVLFIFKPFSLKVRIYIVLITLYFFGLFLLIYIGAKGAGLIYLIGFSLLCAILLGLKAAYKSMFVLGITIILIYAGLYINIFQNFLIATYNAQEWLAVGINLLVISSITTIPLAMLVQQINKLSLRQQNLTNELKDKNATLTVAKDKAEKADELKTRFLANMNHEVRTPLNAIIGFSDLIKLEYIKEPKERVFYMKTINQSGHDLLDIFNNILDTSLIDSNQLIYDNEMVSAENVISELALLFEQRSSNYAHIRLLYQSNINEDGSLMHVDLGRLIQALSNIIHNAIKYSTESDIKIGYTIMRDDILFQIVNQGISISTENQAKIFDPFFKVQHTNMIKEGIGLGLSLAKNFVENMNGKIWVESDKDKGTSFFIQIPKAT